MLRRFVPAWLALAFLVPVCLADEIHLKGHGVDEDEPHKRCLTYVEIIDVSYEKIRYRFLDSARARAGEQDVATEEAILPIVFENPPADYQTGQTLFGQGNYVAAHRSFVRSMSTRGRPLWLDQYALLHIAECQLYLGKDTEAIEAFGDLIKRFPETIHLAGAHLALADLYLAAGNNQEARQTLSGLAKKVKDEGLDRTWGFEARLRIAKIDQGLGEVRDAKRSFRQLADDSGSSAPEIHHLARLGYAHCILAEGDRDGARRIFEELTGNVEVHNPTVLAGAYNGLADCQFEGDEIKPALMSSLRVVLLYPDVEAETPQALFYAARCFYLLDQEGWADRAAQLASRLRSEFPNSPWARKNYKN